MAMTADLKIPENWVLLTGQSMQAFLPKIYGNTSADGDIVAAAHPKGKDDGSIFAQLEYQAIGHVEANQFSKIDVRYVKQKYEEELRIMNGENGLSPSESIKFKKFVVTPKFDYETKSLNYGIELYFGRDPAVNLYKIKLAKEGVFTLLISADYASEISLEHWEIIVDSQMEYRKFRNGHGRKSESSLENLLLINRFI